MSALTKLFVVLLVICSLLMAAATVVFVSRVEDFRATADQQRLQREASERQFLQQVNEARALATAADSREAAAMARLAATNQELLNAQQQLADKSAQLAESSRQIALQALDINRLTEATRASQTQSTALQEQVAQLRTDSDRLVRQITEVNAALSDVTNKYDVTERERRFATEQLTEAQRQLERATAQLRDAGINPTQAPAGVAAGAPAINGVIRSIEEIAGVPYATISVGSADQVQRGMRFNVIDRNQGQFLGYLTVDSVEANESVGRLSGPRVQEIQANAEVRTQL